MGIHRKHGIPDSNSKNSDSEGPDSKEGGGPTLAEKPKQPKTPPKPPVDTLQTLKKDIENGMATCKTLQDVINLSMSPQQKPEPDIVKMLQSVIGQLEARSRLTDRLLEESKKSLKELVTLVAWRENYH